MDQGKDRKVKGLLIFHQILLASTIGYVEKKNWENIHIDVKV